MNKDFTCLRDPLTENTLHNCNDNLFSEEGTIYPIIRGVPRFVRAENYSDDFGDRFCSENSN